MGLGHHMLFFFTHFVLMLGELRGGKIVSSRIFMKCVRVPLHYGNFRRICFQCTVVSGPEYLKWIVATHCVRCCSDCVLVNGLLNRIDI